MWNFWTHGEIPHDYQWSRGWKHYKKSDFVSRELLAPFTDKSYLSNEDGTTTATEENRTIHHHLQISYNRKCRTTGIQHRHHQSIKLHKINEDPTNHPIIAAPSRQRKQSVSEDSWALIIDENEQNVTKELFSDHSDTCSNDDRHDEHKEYKTRKRQLQQQKKIQQYIYHHLQSKVQNQSNTTTSISINEPKQNRRRPNESPHHRNSH